MITFALLLALLGLALIYFEFFLPGISLGIGGGAALLVSSVFFFADKPPIWAAVLYVLALAVLVFFVCKFALWRIKLSKSKDRFYLEKDQEGYLASSFDKELIGKKGMAATDLKPSGHVSFDGQMVQALSESGYLVKGTEVTVVGGRGGYIIVRNTKDV